MSLITIHEGDNIGSIARLQIAHHLDFATINPVSFIAGKQWQEIELPAQSGVLRCEEEETDNGMLYSYEGGFRIHHIRVEVEKGLRPYIGQSAVLRITDNNGMVSILGEPHNPVTLKKESSTGDSFQAVNGYGFAFSVQMTHAAYLV